jgi:hypothetical protein
MTVVIELFIFIRIKKFRIMAFLKIAFSKDFSKITSNGPAEILIEKKDNKKSFED